jgi:hypothetical protein
VAVGGRQQDEARAHAGVQPPDEGRRWTAEIEWRQSDARSRFCVVARDESAGEGTILARSEPLHWPPEDPGAVQALVHAADALTDALVSTGWKALAPGSSWYGRRFEWEPVTTPSEWAPPVAPRSTRPARSPAPGARFRKTPWPRGSEALWRCEIKWSPGYARSRFEAVAHDPERRNDRVVGASTSFKWMLMADPDPGGKPFRNEVRTLAAALEAAGWERLGAGASWYAERFVWRRDEPPPEHVELAPAEAADL